MSDLNEYQKMLRVLKSPYKRTSAYEKYGDVMPDPSDEWHVFWPTTITFVQKYEPVKVSIQKKEVKVLVISK